MAKLPWTQTQPMHYDTPQADSPPVAPQQIGPPVKLRVKNHLPKCVTMPSLGRDGKFDSTALVQLKPLQEVAVDLALLKAMRGSPTVKNPLFAGEVSGFEILGGVDENGIAVTLDHEAGLALVYEGVEIPNYKARLKMAYAAQAKMAELGSRLEAKGDINLGSTIK